MIRSKKYRYSLILLLPAISYIFLTAKFNSLGNYFNYVFVGDQKSYFETAESFYNNLEAHHYRSIGYPILLGFAELFGYSAPYGYWPIILNYLFFFVMLLFFVKIEKELRYNIALTVVILLSFSFGFIKSLNLALTEIGFSMILTWALYNVIRLLKSHSVKDLFLFVLSLGVATLLRPGFYLFTVFIILFYLTFWFYLNWKQIKFYDVSMRASLIILALFLTFGPQSFMMKKTFNTYRLSYIDDITWYRYLGALTFSIDKDDCFTDKCFREEQHKRDVFLRDKSPDQMSDLSKADRKDALKNKRSALLKAYKINIESNIHSGAFNENNKFLNIFTLYTNMVLSIIPFLLYGMIILLRKFRVRFSPAQHFQVLFVLGVISYSILTGAVSAYQGDRFHIVFYPISLITIVYLSSCLIQDNKI